MAAKRGIRIRMSHQRTEALAGVCADMLAGFEPADEHQYLLREYMAELHHRLQGMVRQQQQQYTLALAGAEAIAFYQLWGMLDTGADKYARLVVDGLLQKMSSIAA